MMQRILAIGAHPDDIEIGCGGTLALHVEAGHETHHLCVTSGGAGSDSVPADELARLREAEARRAGAHLGAASVDFLGLADGLTAFTRDDRVHMVNIIRRLRPHLVLVHASRDRFPDHRVVHELVLSALIAASGPWYQEAKGSPWKVGTVLGYEVWHPLEVHQMAIDISRTLPRKLEALRCHASQMTAIRYDEAVAGLARYRGVMTGVGTHAEVFEVLEQPGPFGIPPDTTDRKV
jgi:LmbE family N-acetylglucosaminyl deacetylase